MTPHPQEQMDSDVNVRPSSIWKVPKYLTIKIKVHVLSWKDLIKF